MKVERLENENPADVMTGRRNDLEMSLDADDSSCRQVVMNIGICGVR